MNYFHKNTIIEAFNIVCCFAIRHKKTFNYIFTLVKFFMTALIKVEVLPWQRSWKSKKQEKFIWKIKFENRNHSLLVNSFMRKDLSKEQRLLPTTFLHYWKKFGINKLLWKTKSKKQWTWGSKFRRNSMSWLLGLRVSMLWHFSLGMTMSWNLKAVEYVLLRPQLCFR